MLPIRYYLHRGTIDPARCRAEVAADRFTFKQCGARWVSDRLGAPLCGRHVKWLGRSGMAGADAQEAEA